VTIDRAAALEVALALGREAAEAIARVYAGAFEVDFKGHNDPVTTADREANTLICDGLERAYPGVPIVAEESEPHLYAGFSSSPLVWFVDPLDGTREFVARNGEFAVMIGLAEAGRAVLGVLVMPALGRAFVGGEGLGAYEVDMAGARKPIAVSGRTELRGARAVVSRSRRSPAADAKLAQLGLVAVPCGSAGLKAAKVACGEADLYVHGGRAGKLWDSCAPEAIMRAAGGDWRDARGHETTYAREELENLHGVCAGPPALVAAMGAFG